MRQSKWKPRRDTSGPKTIEEVHRDALLQEMEEKQKINSLPQTSPEGTSSPRGGRQSPISMQGKKGEWMKMSSTKSSRFQVKKPDQVRTLPINVCHKLCIVDVIKICNCDLFFLNFSKAKTQRLRLYVVELDN